ncbi:p-loop containing [Desulfonema magnum]|uniref:P-loop containing n=2 Tax=Desulfonema magnum TaxID=45655 RepID=A0A975BV32_9BACT|nr:p-loop containing [Desulfonema magnum]
MNDNDRKINILNQENPFTSSSVGDPWEDKYLDVKSINERAFKEIFQLIEQKIKNPALPCAGLVFGEVGSGKTHLISRILRYDRESEFPFSFAYIQPIEDPQQTYRYLLREVIVNLCYPINKSSATTQLDIILAKSFKEVGEKIYPSDIEKMDKFFDELRSDPVGLFKAKKISLGMLRDLGKSFKTVIEKRRSERKAIEFMRAKFPDIPKEFFKVLFQYQSPSKRSAAMDWLKGIAIDDEDAALLRVTNRMEDSPNLLEQKSRHILSCLGALLAYYGKPLVVCFDRLENYDTDAKIHSLGKMVEFLVDKAKAMLPLVFVRGQQWEETFTKKLNQQVITRLKTNEFQLKGCNDTQSLEIIRSRLAFVFGKDDTGDLFPFDQDRLTGMFKTRLHTPRQVIMLANQRLKQILYPDKELASPVLPLEKLKEEFENQCKIIRTDFNRYQPDRSRLGRALELYLSNIPSENSFQIESLTRPEDKYLDFSCKVKKGEQASDVIFIIDTELNNPYVRATLKRGIEFLENSSNGKVFYIRDARCEIPAPPKWKATNEMLEEFKKIGGRVIFLDKEHVAEWYALALLNYTVKEGDVTIVDVNNLTKSVSSEELAVFVREKIHGEQYSGFQNIGEILRGA